MGLSGIDLNLLVALDALLTERNVTRAAERTSVGQPAMSASLGRLRKHFGDPLLVREGRRLVPTPFAESLVRPAREAIIAAEAVMRVNNSFDPETDPRSFTIIASDYVILVLLRELLARLVTEAPHVRITVTPVVPDFPDRLRAGQADLLILPTALAGPRCAFPHETLFTDRFVLAVDQDNPDVGECVSAEQFSRLPYLGFSGGALPALAESQLDAMGVERQVEMSTQSFVIAPFLITGTRLVSIVHERLARHVAEHARLRLLPPPVPLQPLTEAMYWNPRHTDDPAHMWLRTRLSDLAATI